MVADAAWAATAAEILAGPPTTLDASASAGGNREHGVLGGQHLRDGADLERLLGRVAVQLIGVEARQDRLPEGGEARDFGGCEGIRLGFGVEWPVNSCKPALWSPQSRPNRSTGRSSVQNRQAVER